MTKAEGKNLSSVLNFIRQILKRLTWDCMLEWVSRYGAYLFYPTTDLGHRQVCNKSCSYISILSCLYYSLACCLKEILDLEMVRNSIFNCVIMINIAMCCLYCSFFPYHHLGESTTDRLESVCVYIHVYVYMYPQYLHSNNYPHQ